MRHRLKHLSRGVSVVLFVVFAALTVWIAVSWAASAWMCYRVAYYTPDGGYIGFESFPHTLIVSRCLAWYREREHQPPVPSELVAETVPTYRIRHDNVRAPPGFLGFASVHTQDANQRLDGYWIPDWFVLLVAGLLAAVASRPVRHAARARHRLKQGRCPGCGYDLRASRGRCPECGAVRPYETRDGTAPRPA